MTVKIINPTVDNQWDDFVAEHEYSTVFHTSAWARVIEETYHYKPRYYVLVNESGQYKAALPFYLIRSRLTGNRMVCLPFSDYCWPLSRVEDDTTLLLKAIEKDIKTGVASYFEIKGWQDRVSADRFDLVAQNGQSLFMLDLEPGVDALKSGFHHNIKDSLRQANKRGVTVRIADSIDDIESFYRLVVATRKKLGVLPQPYSFYKALFRHVISQNMGFILLGEWEGEIIAGSLFLTYKDTVCYKFNASDMNYLKKRPNHLLIMEAIKYACDNRYKSFDFGRCFQKEESLRTFKLGWGAKELALSYYYYPGLMGFTKASESTLAGKVIQLASHVMPRFAFKTAGSLLYKHLG